MKIKSLKHFLSALMALTLSACVEEDPAYPVYYKYRVDVKVDGAPIAIERVIKCTGTLVGGTSGTPGVTTGSTYANPPVIGALVPGTNEAVYTPTVAGCRWAAAEGKDPRFLNPFTAEHKYVGPDALVPVAWVKDQRTFGHIEYFVSKTALTDPKNKVEFVRAYPLELATEQDFLASEIRAETESPDLTPFFFTVDAKTAEATKLYRDRVANNPGGRKGIASCAAAWRIKRPVWSHVPGLGEWVSTLPKDGRAYGISDDFWLEFTELIPINGTSRTPRLLPLGEVKPKELEKAGRFTRYDTISPIISSDRGTYVDLSREGLFGCQYRLLFPDRERIAQERRGDHTAMPTVAFGYDIEGEKLWAQFHLGQPIYVPELDEFLVMELLGVVGAAIGEPVVKGWKE